MEDLSEILSTHLDEVESLTAPREYHHSYRQALTNELILDEIFSKLSYVDILSCRLVCTRWENISLKFFEPTAAITLMEHDENKIEEMLSSEFTLPCNTIRLIDPILSKVSLLYKFFLKYGSQIKELCVETDELLESQICNLKDIIFELLPCIQCFRFGARKVTHDFGNRCTPEISTENSTNPMLKNLKLFQFIEHRRAAQSEVVMNFIQKIFQGSLNLEEVFTNNSIVVELLSENVPNSCISKLKRIHFQNRHLGKFRCVGPLLKLSVRGMQLETFEWEDFSKNPDVGPIVEFCHTQRTCLRNLALHFTQHYYDGIPLMPLMERVEIFEFTNANPIIFKPNNWIVQFPRLKRFYCKSPLTQRKLLVLSDHIRKFLAILMACTLPNTFADVSIFEFLVESQLQSLQQENALALM